MAYGIPDYNRGYRGLSRGDDKVKAAMGGVGVIVVVLFVVLGPCIYRATEETVTITVSEKERVAARSSDESSKYLVSTTSGEVFCVSDSLAYMNCRASDRYFKLKPGRTYRCKVAGWRFGCTSSYRNIIEATEVNSE